MCDCVIFSWQPLQKRVTFEKYPFYGERSQVCSMVTPFLDDIRVSIGPIFRRKKYTTEEDRQILKYLLDNHWHSVAGGNAAWKNMAAAKVNGVLILTTDHRPRPLSPQKKKKKKKKRILCSNWSEVIRRCSVNLICPLDISKKNKKKTRLFLFCVCVCVFLTTTTIAHTL